MPVDRLSFWAPPTTVHPSELHVPLPAGYTDRNPIPTPTTRTPGELLDNFYIERRNDPDWTDPNGVLSKQQEVYNKYPDNAAAPIGSSGLVGKWRRPNGLRAVPVPICGPDPDLNRPPVVIEFRNRNRECPSTGGSLGDLYSRIPDSLEGAGDIVLNKFRGRDLMFSIAWPGYQPEQFTICTVACDGGALTRFDLGQQISTAYALFFRKVEVERLLPREVGFYNIALHQGRSSRSDSLGVQLVQLHLVSFRGTIGGIWVADIEIV